MTASEQDAHALQLRFAGTLCRLGPLTVVPGPTTLLGDLNGARLRTKIGAVSYAAYVFRHQSSAALVVPESVRTHARLALGGQVEPSVRLKRPRLPRRVPDDVRAALDAAGADLATLSEADRRQSLMLIGEAKNAAVRNARIAALIAACRPDDGAAVRRAHGCRRQRRVRALEPARS